MRQVSLESLQRGRLSKGVLPPTLRGWQVGIPGGQVAVSPA